METQDNITPSPQKTALKWGLILGIIGVIISLIVFLTGNMTPDYNDSPLGKALFYISLALVVLFIILAMQEHRQKDLGGYMSYGRALGVGTLVGLYSSLLNGIYTYISLKFLLGPDFIQKMLIYTEEQMRIKNSSMSDDQIEKAMSITEKFMNPQVMSLFAFFLPFLGAFAFSLIIAAFMRKTPPENTYN